MNSVSVIIPARNMAATLGRAVESALDADEVLLYVDSSTDDSYAQAAFLADEYPAQVRLVPPVSTVALGVCAARNILATEAQSDLLIPLDADDYFLPGGIQALVNAYHPHAFVYGLWEADTGQVMQPPPLGMVRIKNVVQATFLFAKSDFLDVGGYDPRFNLGAEDIQLMRAFVRAGLTGTLVHYPVYHYTVNPNGRAADCHRRWPLVLDMLDQYYAINPHDVY